MSMEWIRRNYRVPAKRGGRVEYTGGDTPKHGTIVSGSHRLRIRLDGEERTGLYHPTWKLRYLDSRQVSP